MVMKKKVVGIVGSYRKGHIIDSAVSAVLKAARDTGAETTKIYLSDKNIEFCTNCRTCTQEHGPRGKCIHDDDMDAILTEIETADGVVLGSPINFSTVTALMKRFTERLVVYAYWPWSTPEPKFRLTEPVRKAVIITSSAAPAFIGRILMPNALAVLKAASKCVGAKVVRQLYVGLAAGDKDQNLSNRAFIKAYKAGKKLVL
ncbi:MAG: flavodoxin family protein [Deltaproteobacteria bacterium]|nr:flavodoxin family protein [Deltaproteobacteria bacterium]